MDLEIIDLSVQIGIGILGLADIVVGGGTEARRGKAEPIVGANGNAIHVEDAERPGSSHRDVSPLSRRKGR